MTSCENTVIVFLTQVKEQLQKLGILMTALDFENGNLVSRSLQIGVNIGSQISLMASGENFTATVTREIQHSGFTSPEKNWNIPADRTEHFQACEIARQIRLAFLNI